MIQEELKSCNLWKGAIRPVSACTSLDCSLSYWWGLCWRWRSHLMCKITDPTKRKLCLSSRKQQAFRASTLDRQEADIANLLFSWELPTPLCILPSRVQRVPYPSAPGEHSYLALSTAVGLPGEKDVQWLLFSSTIGQRQGQRGSHKKAEIMPCVLWFGEPKIGSGLSVGEEYVPSKNYVYPLTKAIAGGQCRKTLIRAVVIIEKISWAIISLIDIRSSFFFFFFFWSGIFSGSFEFQFRCFWNVWIFCAAKITCV